MIEVVAVEGLVTVQDLGRPGWAHLGVGRSGAADRGSLRLANRLVGNDNGAAGLEVTFGRLSLRLRRAAMLAVTGAPCQVDVRGGPPLAVGQRSSLPAGAGLTLHPPTIGVRTYVAVRGGIDVEPVLGSRSTDMLGGLGPAPLTAGDVLPIGPEPGGALGAEFSPHALPDRRRLVVWPGPRATPGLLAALARQPWTVGADSDRVGVRLRSDGAAGSPPPPLVGSEPLIRGAVQMPPDGQLIVALADHPTTGGYPVVAVVEPADVDLLAQCRPGDEVALAPLG